MERYQRCIYRQVVNYLDKAYPNEIGDVYEIVEPFVDFVKDEFSLATSIGFYFDVAPTWEKFILTKTGKQVERHILALPSKVVDVDRCNDYISNDLIGEIIDQSDVMEFCNSNKIGKRVAKKLWDYMINGFPSEHSFAVDAIQEEFYVQGMWNDKMDKRFIYLVACLDYPSLLKAYGTLVCVLIAIDAKAIIAENKL